MVYKKAPFYKFELSKITRGLSKIKVPREGLYKSWNRGIKLAKGEYITIWNVDDIRYPESFKEQAQVMDKNIKTMLVYGD